MTTLTATFIPKAPPLREDEHGTVFVADTRVPIDTIIAEYWNGLSAEEIASAYDTVGLANVHAVLGYYLENRELVDAYLRDREQKAAALRKEVEARHPVPQSVIRERLLARWRQRQGAGVE